MEDDNQKTGLDAESKSIQGSSIPVANPQAIPSSDPVDQVKIVEERIIETARVPVPPVIEQPAVVRATPAVVHIEQDVPEMVEMNPIPTTALKSAVGPAVIAAESAPQEPPVLTEAERDNKSSMIPPVQRSGDMNQDIAQILKGTKLPERREYAPVTEKKSTPIPINPFVVSMPNTAEEARAAETGSGEKKRDIVSPMRTLREDLQDVVREKKISLVRAVALEEDKKHGSAVVSEEEAMIRTQRSHRIRGILFFIVLFGFLGAAALFGVLFISQQTTPTPTQVDTSLLFAESAVTLPLNKLSPADVKNLIAQARQSGSATLGSITRIVPLISSLDATGAEVQRSATFSEFMQALGARPPDELLRAVSNDFFFGIHTVDKNAPLFVIQVTSYDHAFAGMLAWEPTMNRDFAPAFTSVPSLVLGPDGLPTQRTFSDDVMRNYDVRELKDDSGVVQLYYSFPTRNILVIAESPFSFTEILSRLQAGRKL